MIRLMISHISLNLFRSIQPNIPKHNVSHSLKLPNYQLKICYYLCSKYDHQKYVKYAGEMLSLIYSVLVFIFYMALCHYSCYLNCDHATLLSALALKWLSWYHVVYLIRDSNNTIMIKIIVMG